MAVLLEKAKTTALNMLKESKEDVEKVIGESVLDWRNNCKNIAPIH